MKTSQYIFSTYNDTVKYLNSSSMFAIKLGLDRINQFLNTIDNPQDKIPSIHIAGTNGKGSVLKYIESILIEAGYKVGSFTSPHLVDYTERICINNQPIPKNDFLTYSNKLFALLEKNNNNHLTQFEFLTVMAFMYFNDNKTDINLIETGLGGQFDATNVIKKPIISVITHIDFDHTEYLGDTLEKIGKEKAGIIKNNSNVVLNIGNKAAATIIDIGKSKNSSVHTSNPLKYEFITNIDDKSQLIIDKNTNDSYTTTLLGEHQLDNISIALEVIDVLSKQGFTIADKQVKTGIKNAKWQGRGEYIKEKNLMLDGAHNPNGAFALRKIVDHYFPNEPIMWIIGTLNTKDSTNILKNLIKQADTVILTAVKANNTSKVDDLFNIVTNNNLTENIITASNLNEAYNHSLKINNVNNLTVITGSLYLIGEYYKLYL